MHPANSGRLCGTFNSHVDFAPKSSRSRLFLSVHRHASMTAPFGGLRNGDDHKNLVHEFSSERGDKPPLELSRSLRVDRKDRPRIDSS